MIHAGNVATSADELAQAIDRTDDLREKLKAGGYGTAFDAEELFPLYEGAVARATNAAATRSAPATSSSSKWLWVLGAAAIVAVVVILLLVAG